MITALLNTIMGMGTVFLVLIFISLIISLFHFIPVFQARMEQRKQRKREEERRNSPERPVPKRPVLETEKNDEYEDNEEDMVMDGELVAVITAAVLASMGGAVSADKLVVRSIRRVKTKNRR